MLNNEEEIIMKITNLLESTAKRGKPTVSHTPIKYHCFNMIWTNTEAGLVDSIMILRKTQTALINRKISPTKIIGNGYKPEFKREIATKWLSDSIKDRQDHLLALNTELIRISDLKECPF